MPIKIALIALALFACLMVSSLLLERAYHYEVKCMQLDYNATEATPCH